MSVGGSLSKFDSSIGRNLGQFMFQKLNLGRDSIFGMWASSAVMIGLWSVFIGCLVLSV